MRAAFAIVLLFPVGALAQPAYELELDWSAPPGCPDGAAIEANLASIVALAEGHTPPRLEAIGAITATPTGYELVLQTVRDGVRGERRLQAANCREFESGASLILALSLGDGVALMAPPEADTEPDPVPEPERETEEEPEPETEEVEPDVEAQLADRAPEAEPPPAWTLGLSLELGGGWGTLPRLSPRAGVGLELGRADWRLRLRVASDLLAVVDVTDLVRATFRSGEVGLGACWTPTLAPRLRADACAGTVLLATWGRGEGADDNAKARAVHVALGGTIGLTVSLGPSVALRLLVDVAAPTVRPRFTITNLGEVHRVEALRVASVLGVLFRLR